MNYPHQPGSPSFEGGAAYESHLDQAERERIAAAAPDLLEAAEMLETAEDGRQDCEECEGDGEPEACSICFPAFDDARIKRRLAIAKARGRPLSSTMETKS